MSDNNRTYVNGDLKVFWQPELCSHCGDCARELPAVFRPALRPWVHLEGALPEEVIEQVVKCPSGALTIL